MKVGVGSSHKVPIQEDWLCLGEQEKLDLEAASLIISRRFRNASQNYCQPEKDLQIWPAEEDKHQYPWDR